MRPFRLFLALWISLSVAAYLLFPHLYPLPWIWRLLLTLNVTTFILYLIDKIQAQSRGLRVPERMLYLASFLGGSAGALLAMNLLRHKTRKIAFQLVLGVLIFLQILAGLWYAGMFQFTIPAT